VDAVGSGCVVLWSLKQGNEQLEGVSMVLGRLEVCDILWERAGWAFVFLWLGVAYAAEGGGHGYRVDAICNAMRLGFFALDRVQKD
jgi:hypothetical protein